MKIAYLAVLAVIAVLAVSGCITPGLENKTYEQGFNDGVKSIMKSCYNGTEEHCLAMSGTKDGACLLVFANNSECKVPE
jgi:hypothetical protein